jgi:hypothetical protein
MIIDERVEPLVRSTIEAVVKRDMAALQGAFARFPDDESMTYGAQLASAVGLYVLHDVYGREPTAAEIRAVANKLAEMESWTDVTADEVVLFLSAALAGQRADRVLPLERVAILPYVIAGNLLASCCKEGEWWFDYLDRAESAIEAT